MVADAAGRARPRRGSRRRGAPRARGRDGVKTAQIIGRSRRWYNYDLPEGLIGSAWQGRYRGQTQLWFAARFEGEDSEIDLSPRPGHEQEFDAWRWVSHTQLPSLIVPFKRDVY